MTATLAFALAASEASAASYDPAANFSVSNPNEPWSYGYRTSISGSFTQFSLNWSHDSLSVWGNSTQFPQSYPQVLKNEASTEYNSGNGFIMAPSGLDIAPGNSELADVRFTVPVTGIYLLSASFSSDQHPGWGYAGATLDVHISVNDNSLIDGYISQYGDIVGVSKSLFLNKGDKIDFLAGNGQNGFYADSVGLVASISTVPEPSTMIAGALILVPFGISTLRMLRKNRAN